MHTMKELEYVDSTWLCTLEAMLFIKKLIASGTGRVFL